MAPSLFSMVTKGPGEVIGPSSEQFLHFCSPDKWSCEEEKINSLHFKPVYLYSAFWPGSKLLRAKGFLFFFFFFSFFWNVMRKQFRFLYLN